MLTLAGDFERHDTIGKIINVADRQPRAFFRDIHELASFKKGVALFFGPGWHISGLAKRETPLKKMPDHLFEAISVKTLSNIAPPTLRPI